MKKVLLFWSGGKDSALALYYLKKNPEIQIAALVTTMNAETNSNDFHGIPETLYNEQAKLLNLPLLRIFLPKNITNDEYEKLMLDKLKSFKKIGVDTLVFGDIHLAEVRNDHQKLADQLEMHAHFPLWGKKSAEVIQEFFSTGHRAIVTAIHTDFLAASFLNKEFSAEWVESLPEHCDAAGENGEYHTITTFGPYFKMRLNYSKTMAKAVGPYLVTQLREP